MKVETSTVTKMVITDLDRLDPITVMIDNFEPGKGKIMIECYGQCWTNYWGAMSGMTVQQFFQSCNVNYLAEKFAPRLESEILDEGPALVEAAKNQVEQLMDAGDIDELEAVHYISRIDRYLSNGLEGNEELLRDLFGYDGIYYLPTKPNHEYQYLCRIIEAVKMAFMGEDDDE